MQLSRGLLSVSLAVWCGAIYVPTTSNAWDLDNADPEWKGVLEKTTAQENFCKPRNVDIVQGRPIPTNTWWGNLITCANGTNTQPVWANPYTIFMDTDTDGKGIAVGYAYHRRYFGQYASGQIKFYSHRNVQDLTFGAEEFASKGLNGKVTSWTDAGARIEVRTLDVSTAGVLESPIVNGMAYITMYYTELTPLLTFISEIVSVESDGNGVDGNYVGNRFIVSTNDQKWVVYASDEIQLKRSGEKQLVNDKPYSGTIRAALVIEESQLDVYDTHSECISTGGAVQIVDAETYEHVWETEGECLNGLLHFALPHQFDTIDPKTATEVSSLTMFSATRGEMKAYITLTEETKWTLTETGTISVDFYPSQRLKQGVKDLSYLDDQLRKDIDADWNIPDPGSIYFGGKEVQKRAMLCLMANDKMIVGEDETVLSTCLSKLQDLLIPLIENTWTYELIYDQVYGGIVTSEGFTTGYINADYGNAAYNDHHYHYGYWVYTAAVLNYLDSTWERLDDLNRITRLLIRDVATETGEDPYFPKFRAFDWYRGHSYSHGQTTFPDGKNQESTSEDINFSFAMYLFSRVTGDVEMAQTSKLMTKLNIRSIQTYFLLAEGNTIHPEEYRGNLVTGIHFDNKADYTTFFCSEKHCIHGIHMLPVTPILDVVRTTEFVKQEWESILSQDPIIINNSLDNAWAALLYVNYARINKEVAQEKLWNVDLDHGLTRSWALYCAHFAS